MIERLFETENSVTLALGVKSLISEQVDLILVLLLQSGGTPPHLALTEILDILVAVAYTFASYRLSLTNCITFCRSLFSLLHDR